MHERQGRWTAFACDFVRSVPLLSVRAEYAKTQRVTEGGVGVAVQRLAVCEMTHILHAGNAAGHRIRCAFVGSSAAVLDSIVPWHVIQFDPLQVRQMKTIVSLRVWLCVSVVFSLGAPAEWVRAAPAERQAAR